MNTQETALITGASSGIGFHFAEQFASNGHPVVLVAQNEEELQRISEDFQRRFGVQTWVHACDLEDDAAPQGILDRLTNDAIEIGILVNNAGHGFKDNFWDIPIEKDLSMIRLNIQAVLRLTKLFLPGMMTRGRGRILNTASVAAFEPGPLLAVYHATKAFVLSLSEALATELQDQNITVTALCPGQTDTDFFPKAGMMDTAAFQKLHVMAPQDVAKMGYKATMKGQRVIVAGAVNKAMVFSRHLVPESAQAKMNMSMYKDVAPEEHKRERGDFEREAEAKATRA